MRCVVLFLVFQPPLDVPKTKVPPEADEFVLDQLSVCEEKLLKLIEDLDSVGKDEDAIRDLVNQDEVKIKLQRLSSPEPEQ